MPRGRPRKPPASTWWAQAWLESLESGVGWHGRLAPGRTYAREGRVRGLVIEPGHATAHVQGQRVAPYRVGLRFATLDGPTWQQAIAVMARQATVAAMLLAAELPRAAEDALRSLSHSLFPLPDERVAVACSCPDRARPCKHGAAVAHAVAAKIDGDPFVLFTLRGRGRDELVAALRAERLALLRPLEVVAPTQPALPDLEDLGGVVERFWSGGGVVDVPPLEDPLPALKRLGYPPPSLGGGELRRELGEAYRLLRERADRLGG